MAEVEGAVTLTTRLYHLSEDPGIERFVPRVSSAEGRPLVWAVDAEHAYLYYFPRQCPRVTFQIAPSTTPDDIACFFGHTTATRVAAIEAGWLAGMRETTVYRYELPPHGFELLDAVAGYWVSSREVTPVAVEPVGDLMAALTAEGVEVRVIPSLWPLYEAVVASSLGFSIIRWRNASPRPEAFQYFAEGKEAGT